MLASEQIRIACRVITEIHAQPVDTPVRANEPIPMPEDGGAGSAPIDSTRRIKFGEFLNPCECHMMGVDRARHITSAGRKPAPSSSCHAESFNPHPPKAAAGKALKDKHRAQGHASGNRRADDLSSLAMSQGAGKKKPATFRRRALYFLGWE